MAAKTITMEEQENLENMGIPTTPEEMAVKEVDLVSTLLHMADYRTDEDMFDTVQIYRGGVSVLSFRVRPLSADEMKKISDNSKKLKKNPKGKNLPPVEDGIDTTKLMANTIITATVKADRLQLWENAEIRKGLAKKFPGEVVDTLDVVTHVLTAGEMTKVFDKIQDVSGLNDDGDEVQLEEYSKN